MYGLTPGPIGPESAGRFDSGGVRPVQLPLLMSKRQKRELRRNTRHFEGGITVTPFFSPDICDQLVTLSEKCSAENGGWTNESNEGYAQKTVDLEVDKFPILKAWVKKNGLLTNVASHYKEVYGASLHALDDLFIVKYEAAAAAQKELLLHTDAGDLSFMVALSRRDAYSGGGTYFKCLDETLDCEQGELMCFDADLFHRRNLDSDPSGLTPTLNMTLTLTPTLRPNEP